MTVHCTNSDETTEKHIMNAVRNLMIQESLANAKVSVRQPWYIGRNSLNQLPLRIAQQYQRNLYIVEKYFQCATIPSLTMWVYLHSFSRCCLANMPTQLAQNSKKIWIYSSSMLSKVNDFGTNQKCICEFLLVTNSNFGPTLHRFWDTATYWLKIAYFYYPSVIWCPRSLSSLWNFAVMLSARKLASWGYSVVKVAWS